jgi:hypothetical protein
MKRKFFNPILLIACFIVVIAVIADLNGKWKGTLKTPDGNEIPLTYNFKVDGDKLTGTAETPEGSVPIDSGKVAGDTFKFQVTVDGSAYPHTGMVYADSCSLAIGFQGTKLHTTLKRAVDK